MKKAKKRVYRKPRVEKVKIERDLIVRLMSCQQCGGGNVSGYCW